MSTSTRLILFVWFMLIGAAMHSSAAFADASNNVLSPGPVIKGHAKYESECSNCHKRFDKAAQADLCKNCHKEINQDQTQSRGFHGLFEENKQCKECHHEHKGRDVSLIVFDTKGFEHGKRTGYELKGGHLGEKVECKSCHHPGKKYRESEKTCAGCHAKQDKHKGSLGKQCQNCHEEKDWKTLHYDHSKTHFQLGGKHLSVKCSACHADNEFKHTPIECNACHKKDDKHKSNFGPKCETCHTDKNWKDIRFDHNKQTKYRLEGKHGEIKCESCHTGKLYKNKLKTDCYSCHKKDDKHNGLEGKKCESCHVPQSWKKTDYDHRRSRFALTGMHTLVKCEKCHTTPNLKETKSDCLSCHRKQDPHEGRLGNDCERCHNTRNWQDWDFDHDKTDFKLQNKHARLRCVECHNKPVETVGHLSGCMACHGNDDKHDGAYGEACDHCHLDTTWRTIKIGNDELLKFKSGVGQPLKPDQEKTGSRKSKNATDNRAGKTATERKSTGKSKRKKKTKEEGKN